MKQVGSYEAKTHLPALLDYVERGKQVLITRRGRPAARLVPISHDKEEVHAAIEGLRAYSKKQGRTLGRISIRTLINEGRHY